MANSKMAHLNDDPHVAQTESQNRTATEGSHDEDELDESSHRFLLFNVMPSWLVSFLTHVALILILALLVIDLPKKETVSLEAGAVNNTEIDSIDINLDALDLDTIDALESEISEAMETKLEEDPDPITVDTEAITEFSTLLADNTTNFDGQDVTELPPLDTSNETSSRNAESREQLLRKYGGNAASEKAVERALQWIADHQLPDGGWNLDHTIGKENGRPRTSPNPGSRSEARFGATALALLPFLGNGQTHLDGKHKKVVLRGLNFLMEHARRRGSGISYHEPGGTMYSHGLVAIVFCEAYAMTKDSRLEPFAQGTLKFIEQAQDPVGGGWRYEPKMPGDTSVVGWQLMALKSGKLSGLEISKQTYKLMAKFLDSVSIDSGAIYGYRERPADRDRGHLGQTAVGLLCRMYMGWDKNSPGLTEGVEWMADMGPDISKTANMYYNYYATQVMKHYGGATWKKWNNEMRDYLVNSQSKEGVTEGSWFFNPNSHAQEAGGRLYVTSLCCMTLEVYYRFLPIYGDEATQDVFPLD